MEAFIFVKYGGTTYCFRPIEGRNSKPASEVLSWMMSALHKSGWLMRHDGFPITESDAMVPGEYIFFTDTGSTGPSTSASRVQRLLELYKQQQLPNVVADSLAKRSGPIQSDSDGLVMNVGEHFPLVGVTRCVDQLLKVLSHLHIKFTKEYQESFMELLQILRVVGAPGTGKSTILRSIWGLLLQRIKEVRESSDERDRALWEVWKEWGVPQLEVRLKAWGSRPWVYVLSLDGSMNGLQSLLDDEKSLTVSTTLALRMLFGVVGSIFDYQYVPFFEHIQTDEPQLLKLRPVDVMKFVQALHGVSSSEECIGVWAFDDVNAVAYTPGRANWFQQQLSEAVAARKAALTDKDCSMMPVFIAASTRGSAISLQMTCSRKARIKDMRLASVSSVHEQQLMVMDVFRRLPWPTDLTNSSTAIERPQALPEREGSLTDLTEKQQEQLLTCCPAMLKETLQWCGNLFRAVEHTLAVCSGAFMSRNFRIGALTDLFQVTPSICANTVVQKVASRLAHSDWDRYLAADQSRRHELALAVFAYSVTWKAVSRSTVLVASPAPSIRVQDLEACGMILVVPRSTMDEDNGPWTYNHDSDEQPNQAAADDMGVYLPDHEQDLAIVLPPILVLLFMRWLESKPDCFQQWCQLPLLEALADFWRIREFTDVNTLALRLQLYRVVFRKSTVVLRDLHPGFAGGDCDVEIFTPTGGFLPTEVHGEMTDAKFADLVSAASPQSDWSFVGPEQSDSWVILFEADPFEKKATEKRVIINIQSKLRMDAGKVSSASLLEEVKKVPLLQQGHYSQAFLYVSDERPSSELEAQWRALQQQQLRRSVQVMHWLLLPEQQPEQPQQQQATEWQLQWCSRKRAVALSRDGGTMDVVLVLGAEHHLYSGATLTVKEAIERLQKQNVAPPQQ